VELLAHNHPLKTVTQELAAHGQCVALALGGLSQPEVAAYVAQRGVATAGGADVAAVVYQRTEGHPLFMVQVVDALAQQDLLPAPAQPGAGSAAGLAIDQVVPQGLQQLLEAQVGRLEALEQQVLEVGSVAGAEFVVASVAAGGNLAPEVVEAVCERLAQRGQFLEERDLVAWPDGTVSGGYGWRHALYQEVLYRQLGSGRRARYHRAIGARLEAGYGAQVAQIAAALAMHFARGQDPRRAVQYLGQAADNAAQRQAPHEVIALLTTGLALLATLPDTPVRAQQELALQLTLAPALNATKGRAAPEVGQTYARARALCAQVSETPLLFPALQGLCEFYRNRGELLTARELGEELDRLAQRAAEPTSRLEAHDALGTTLFVLGEFPAALMYVDQSIALTDPTAQRALALRYGAVPGVRCLGIAASTLWCLGYPAQALQRQQEALALAHGLALPYSMAVAHHWAAYLHHLRREVPTVQAQAEALLTLATLQGFPLYVGYGTCWRGWALAMQGQGEAGLEQLQQGTVAVLATGQTLSRSLCLFLRAEAAGYADQVAEGLRLLAEALTAFEESKRGNLLAEAYRLQGEFLLRQAVPDPAQAEACFHQALGIASRQQAKSWELRAALSLSRLWQHQGKRAEAHALLAPVYNWFTEGFDTADLQEAKAQLAALS
jgi:predicted ATPase